MTDYHRSIEVPVSPERAFAFVSDLKNLPKYVPTTRKAEETGRGHVHVEGENGGQAYADDGHFFVDAERRLMRWGSGESGYRGELAVDATDAGTRIAIAVHFHDGGNAPSGEQIEASLQESLSHLRAELAKA